eukprot:2587679-Rhodomonas_salina.1
MSQLTALEVKPKSRNQSCNQAEIKKSVLKSSRNQEISLEIKSKSSLRSTECTVTPEECL